MTINAQFNIQQGGFELEFDLTMLGVGTTAIFGASGSGKTTLLRAIAGLDHHMGASLIVAGEVWQQDNEFLPPHLRSIGYVFQETSLFAHMTVQQNLDYAWRRANKDGPPISVARAVDLLELAPLLNEQPTTLSGGERQRVAIARALCTRPKLLLMDEPLTGLDNAAKARLLPLIDSTLRKLKIPCLYVSHSIDEVSQLADNIILLEAGKVVQQGDMQYMLTRLDLPLAQHEGAESIVPATVIEYDEHYKLSYLDSDMGRFTMARKVDHSDSEGQESIEGKEVRIRILARDVSLTLNSQKDTSILNIFPATVSQLQPYGESQVTVKLLLNKTPLLARITVKSADLLKLKVGQQLYAQAKTVSLY